MYGRVSSEKLNIRSYPGRTGEVVGSLSKNALIDIRGQSGGWYRFNYNKSEAYVFARYIEKTDNPKNLKGIVTASKLNVRRRPSGAGDVLGVINLDALVNIVDDEGDWYEIQFNNQPGFVHKDYVALSDVGEAKKGAVTTNLLNVRKQPSPGGQKLGQLTIDSIVSIVAEVNGWYEIKFNNETAFVFGKYIRSVDDEDSGRYFYQKPRFRDVPLKPDMMLDVPSDKEGRRTANTWNDYGNLIKEISNIVDIDVGCAIAVLCVESSGQGFNTKNDDRMVIRFENHQFWRRWGKFNQDEFFEHFTFDDDQSWKKHTFRERGSDEWMKFHGRQRKEWQVLDFARSLDDSAALKSISMGAPQIMGFNYQQTGYQSVQQMFNNLSTDIRYHIFALFDFLDNRMISALQNYDFVKFARFYNGPGQAEHYGEWIKEHFEAFQGFRI